MYQPQSFKENNQDKLYRFIETYSFATILAIRNNLPEISHLPLILDTENNCLRGHIARANPLLEHIEQGSAVTVIFHGPHGYVSPLWYKEPLDNVATWNYAVVHVAGKLVLSSQEELIKLLDQLQDKHDKDAGIDWNNPRINAKLAAIAGFRVEIKTITGKFKLSQNRSKADQLSIRDQFMSLNQELAILMTEHNQHS